MNELYELQKRVAELQGWKVVAGENCPQVISPWAKPGVYIGVFGVGKGATLESGWKVATEYATRNPLSLLDEAEKAGCKTDLFGYSTTEYLCTIYAPKAFHVRGDGSTREEAIYRAYIAWKEAQK